jgi:hypothetical protein
LRFQSNSALAHRGETARRERSADTPQTLGRLSTIRLEGSRFDEGIMGFIQPTRAQRGESGTHGFRVVVVAKRCVGTRLTCSSSRVAGV